MPVTEYIWDVDNDSLLMETDGDGNPTAIYTNTPDSYGELISQHRDGQTYYHHYDGEENTRQVTDENQSIVESATYNAFGEIVEKTSSIVNPFGYKGALGYYTNGDTGEVLVRGRIYLPLLARWISAVVRGSSNDLNRYLATRPWENGSRSTDDETPEPEDFPPPKNRGDCYGLCIGGYGFGEVVDLECKLTSYKAHPDNPGACPTPKDAEQGCNTLVARFKSIQGDGKKSWGINLCGPCECNYDEGQNFSKDRAVTMTVEDYEIGQSTLVGVCRYAISGSITLTVKSGTIRISSCKPKC